MRPFGLAQSPRSAIAATSSAAVIGSAAAASTSAAAARAPMGLVAVAAPFAPDAAFRVLPEPADVGPVPFGDVLAVIDRLANSASLSRGVARAGHTDRSGGGGHQVAAGRWATRDLMHAADLR